MKRIDPNILTEGQKDRLRKTVTEVRKTPQADEHGKAICHYLLKLMNFQAELEDREHRISQFVEVCNRYFDSELKRIVYDSNTFSVKIEDPSIGTNIELQHLSSGEKQIVSLFGHLYLSWDDRFFAIIDEPELSLSVPWQRMFLVDISKAERCAGFIAATHSPFIYENELEKYARGLGEFTSIERQSK